MDIHLLTAEHRGVADAFRAQLTRLATMRAQLLNAITDEGRQHLYVAVDEGAAECRALGDELIRLDKMISAMGPNAREQLPKYLAEPPGIYPID